MSKKILMFAALGIAMISSGNLFAARNSNIQYLDANGNGVFEEGEVDPCREYRCGPARCTYPVTRFKKRTYCTKRCVQEPYTVRKKCVRYRPEYYTKTYCKKVPECYYTCETRYRTRYVNDEHCCYEPYTYCRTECVNLNDCATCDQGGCPANGGNSQAYYQSSPSYQAPVSNYSQRNRTSRHY